MNVMSRTSLVTLFGVLALATMAVLAGPDRHRSVAESRPGDASALHPGVEPHLDPRLRFLLTQAARGEPHEDSPFFRTLSAVARERGWDPPDVHTTEGRAVGVREGNSRYAVVILGWESPDTRARGGDSQDLLLLGPDGRLLDRLSCGISNRQVRGTAFRTDTPHAAEGDGARFIIRYLPAAGYPVWEGLRYDVDHGPKNARFRGDDGRPGPFLQEEWVRQGLCRVTVGHGKLQLLFPSLEK